MKINVRGILSPAAFIRDTTISNILPQFFTLAVLLRQHPSTPKCSPGTEQPSVPTRGGRGTHRSKASRVTSRKGCSTATAALFTSSSKGPAAPTAASVASQSARSRHKGSMPGHCGEGGPAGGPGQRRRGWTGGRWGPPMVAVALPRHRAGGSRAGSRGGCRRPALPLGRDSPGPPPCGSAPSRGPRLCSAPRPRRVRSLRGDGVSTRPPPPGPRRPAPVARPPLPAPVTRARRPWKLRCCSMLR